MAFITYRKRVLVDFKIISYQEICYFQIKNIIVNRHAEIYQNKLETYNSKNENFTIQATKIQQTTKTHCSYFVQ